MSTISAIMLGFGLGWMAGIIYCMIMDIRRAMRGLSR